MSVLSGWGRTAPSAAHLVRVDSTQQLREVVAASPPRGVLVRGLGRSYGDAAQNAGGTVLDLSALDTIGPIDPATGEIDCGAGVSIDALLRATLPQGWFVPVTPGTRMVSLGGALAADVHGKNHHRDGSLGGHVTAVELVSGGAELIRARAGDDAHRAVTGGLGLAAAVTSVRLRLRPVTSSWMHVDTRRTGDLDATMAALTEADARRGYSVAWVDCLAGGAATGRAVVTSGDHAGAGDIGTRRGDPLAFDPHTRIAAPPWAPRHVLGRRRVAAFNEAYYRRAPRHRDDEVQPLARFFHPLDGIEGWNRLYGGDGFVQYQFAAADPELVPRALKLLQAAGAPAFLGVLKRFGPPGDAPLSFPTAGWTLALDLPADPALAAVLDRLDGAVADAGGRVYLAKDARLRPDLMPTMYPRLGEWRELRDALDPHHVFCSDLARRLHL